MENMEPMHEDKTQQQKLLFSQHVSLDKRVKYLKSFSPNNVEYLGTAILIETKYLLKPTKDLIENAAVSLVCEVTQSTDNLYTITQTNTRLNFLNIFLCLTLFQIGAIENHESILKLFCIDITLNINKLNKIY